MSQPELIVVVKDDPFSDRPPRLIKAEAGTPVSELVDMAGFEQLELEHAEASINGEVVEAELWAETPGHDHVQIAVLPQGGGSGNKLLRTVLSIALVIAAFYLGPIIGGAIAGALGVSGTAASFITGLATAAITTLGQLAINAIVPPPSASFNIPDAPDPVYFIEGARNRLAPLSSIQTVLGRHRITPRLAARPYPEIRGDDTFYYMVVDLGPIGVEVTDRKVGDTPIANLDGAVWQSRLVATDPHPNMASRQVIPTSNMGITLLHNDPELRRTALDVIDCDMIFQFPAGLGRTNDRGNPESVTLTLQVRYREVLNPGPSETFGPWRFATSRVNPFFPDFRGFETSNAAINLYGGGISGFPYYGTAADFTFRESKPGQPFFRQVGFSFPTEGTYEVEVTRISADSSDGRTFDDIIWQGLLAKRDDPIITRDDVAYEVYRFKGTDETSGAIDELNMVVGRFIPGFPDAVLDQADLSGVTAADLSLSKVSSNGWEQILWAKRNGFEAREAVDDAGFDWPSFAAAAKDARDRGLSFDFVIQDNIDVDDLVSIIASSGGEGRVYSYNNVLTAGVDRPIAAPTHVFSDQTARNISYTKSFPEDVHAYDVTFNDANNGYRTRTVRIYVNGFTALTATKFEPLKLPGKVQWTDLHRAMAQLYRNSRLQTTNMRLEIPNEALDNSARPMRRISVATRVITQVQGSGVVRGITTNAGQVTAIDLDQEIEQGPSFPGLALKWITTDASGNQTLSAPAPLVIPGTDGLSTTATLITPVATASGPVAGDDYIIGPVGTDLFEGLLENAEKAGEGWVRLNLKDYAPARFDETGTTIPTYATEPVLPLGSRPPQPTYVGAQASNFRVTVNFTVPDGYQEPLQEIRVWRAYAPPATDPEPNTLSVFEQLAPLAPQARQLVDAAGQVGQRIVYRFQAVAVSGRAGPILDTPIITVADALPAIAGLSATASIELGIGGVSTPIIAVAWTPETASEVLSAVLQLRVVALDGSSNRLPEGSQPPYETITEVKPDTGTFTVRGLTGGLRYDFAIYYRGARGETGAFNEVQDITVAASTSVVDWPDITNPPGWVIDGRVPLGLDANGDVFRNIPLGILDGSNVLRWPNGGIFTGTLNADRTQDNIAADFVGRGWGATADQNTADNARAGIGQNSLKDTHFRNAFGALRNWRSTGSGATLTTSVLTVSQYFRAARISFSGNAGGWQGVITGQENYLPCRTGDRIGAAGYVGCSDIATNQLHVTFIYYDNAGGYLSEESIQIDQSGLGGNNFSNYRKFSVVGAQISNANVRSCRFRVFGYSSVGSGHVDLLMPTLAQMQPDAVSGPEPSFGADVMEGGANATEGRIAGGFFGQGTQSIANAERGNTASRPSSPPTGSWYINTQTSELEFYDGSSWNVVSNIGGSSLRASVSPTQADAGRSGAGLATSNLVTVTPVGGSGSYSYQWSVGGQSGVSITSATSAATTFFKVLALGEYISELAVCTIQDTVTFETTQVYVGINMLAV